MRYFLILLTLLAPVVAFFVWRRREVQALRATVGVVLLVLFLAAAYLAALFNNVNVKAL